MSGLAYSLFSDSGTADLVSLLGNDLQMPNGGHLIEHNGSNHQLYAGNRCWTTIDVPPNDDFQCHTGSPSAYMNFPDWLLSYAAAGDTSTFTNVTTYVNRNVGPKSYMLAAFGETYATEAEAMNALLARARANQREDASGNPAWDDRATATAFNDHVRAGYGIATTGADFGGIRVLGPVGVIEVGIVEVANAPSGMGGVLMACVSPGVVRAVVLVETGDPEASPVRVRTTTGTKALRLRSSPPT